MSMLDDARRYLSMGFAVIPLNPRDKVAALEWKEFQARLPTDDELVQWFGDGVEHNIGIVCGAVSGNLVVIDFDDLSAVPYVADTAEIIKKTMAVKTGKGIHIYERCREPLNGLKLPNLHIDVKGEGGYVVAPPSLHPSGVRYQLLNDVPPREGVDGNGAVSMLQVRDRLLPFVNVIKSYWKEGQRNDLLLGLSAFFNKRARWQSNEMEILVDMLRSAVPGLHSDAAHDSDTIHRAFEQGYGYLRRLPDDLAEELTRLLPRGGELWNVALTVNAQKQPMRWMVCSGGSVAQAVLEGKDSVKTRPVFSQPLQLVSAWHVADAPDNDILFTVLLGDRKYTGSKTAIAKDVLDKAVTGTNAPLIPDAIGCCVEHYISSGLVDVKDAFGAIGVYAVDHGDLKLVLPDDPELPLTYIPGTEPWIVAKDFRLSEAQLDDALHIYSRLPEFFDDNILALMFGWSAVAPFSYALRAGWNYFWPLLALVGPRGTGKSTIGDLFTGLLYGVPEGGPTDLTSEFRIMDFLSGTTFPRKVDETENAHFEASKFGANTAPVLKDASSKQWVGKRGQQNRTKDLYAARTPLVLVGNKLDISDGALLARTIVLNVGIVRPIRDSAARSAFNLAVVDAVPQGWGVQFTKWCCKRLGDVRTLRGLIKEAGKVFSYSFWDARREDFYASFYVGLQLWDEFFTLNHVDFPLRSFLEPSKFRQFIGFIEEISVQEGAEKQSIVSFCEWIRTRYGFKQQIEVSGAEPRPQSYYEILQMISLEAQDDAQWLYFTQPSIIEYRRVDTSFPYRTLGEVADALAQFYGVPKTRFYNNRSSKKIGQGHHKAARIPYDSMSLSVDSFSDDVKNDNTGGDLAGLYTGTPLYTGEKTAGVQDLNTKNGAVHPYTVFQPKAYAREGEPSHARENSRCTGVPVYAYKLPEQNVVHRSDFSGVQRCTVRFLQDWSDIDDNDNVVDYTTGQEALMPTNVAMSFQQIGIVKVVELNEPREEGGS